MFAGKHGFITPRDLFRWAGRGAVGYQELAEAGFMVLGERLRNNEERDTVLHVLNTLLKAKVRSVQVSHVALCRLSSADEWPMWPIVNVLPH